MMKGNLTSNACASGYMQQFKMQIRNNFWRILVFALVATGATCLQNIIVIELIGRISTLLVEGKGKGVLPFIAIFLSVYILAEFLKYIQTLIQVFFARNMSIETEQDFLRVYGDIQHKEYFFEREKVKGQLRKAVFGVESASSYICTVISTAVTLSISIGYLSYLNVYAIFLCIAVSALFTLLLHKDNTRLSEITERFNNHMKVLYARQWEQIKNHSIASFLRQSRVIAPYLRTIEDFTRDLRQIKVISNRSNLVSNLGVDIVVICTAILGAVLFFQGKIEIGGVLQIILCVPYVADALLSVPKLRNIWQSSKCDMRMVDEFYQKMREQGEIVRVNPSENEDVEITVENLSFHYRNQTKDILQNLNLNLTTGVHLLKGSSGCGKTTFLRILAGEFPVHSGKIILGNLEITADTKYDFSPYVAYMTQEPVIVCGTVKENIVLGNQMNQERFNQVIKRADLQNLLQKLPLGEDTPVSSDVLSSGEKQKIALARVFYQNKPVWILDEPVSALDPSSIQRIIESIISYGKERVIVMTSHQPLGAFQMKIHLFGVNEANK